MNQQQLHESVITKFIRGKPDTLYDIGVGPKSEWRTLRNHYPQLCVFGCEPHPETFESVIRSGFPGPLANIAIGEVEGETQLFDVPDDPKRASLLPIADGVSQHSVKVWTLNRFDLQMGSPSRILLWLDIEGSELSALRSGARLLASGRVRWINLEERRNGDRPATGWTDPAELHALLTSFDFMRVADYNRHPTHQDAIYVHRKERK